MTTYVEQLLEARTPQEIYSLVKHELVPALADWCEIHLPRPDGGSELVAALHKDKTKTNDVLEHFSIHSSDPDKKLGVPLVLTTGVAERVEIIPDALLPALFPDAEELKLIRSLGYASTLAVPLKHDDKLLGVVFLVRGSDRKGFSETDLEAAEAVTSLATNPLETLLKLHVVKNENRDLRRRQRSNRVESLKYKKWLEASPVSTMILSKEGYTLEVNKAFEDFWGISIEKDVAYNVSLFGDEQLQATQVIPFFERAIQGDSVTGLPTFYDARVDENGKARFFRHKIAPIPSASGKVKEIVVVHLELSSEERTEAEKRLTVLGVDLPRDIVKATTTLLSPRELGVLRLVAEGLSNKQIARTLSISENTAKFHITSLFNKLGVNSRAQAVANAVQQGLL
jgi:PAS domain S-box-containing protein